MHIAEMDASTEDLRVTAMHLRSPIHTLLLNIRGELLGANTSALEACHMYTPGTIFLPFCLAPELPARHVIPFDCYTC